MSERESRDVDAALTAASGGKDGNGSSKIAEALALLLRPVYDALDGITERVDVLEGSRSDLLRHIDARFDEHNAMVLQRLTDLETGRASNQEAIARMDDSLALLSTTTKSDAGHRRETNRKVIETVEALDQRMMALEREAQTQRQLQEQEAIEAQHKAEERHAQLLTEQQRMASLMRSFNDAVTRYGAPVAVALTVFLITNSNGAPTPLRTAAYAILAIGGGVYLLYWIGRYAVTRRRLNRLRSGKP